MTPRRLRLLVLVVVAFSLVATACFGIRKVSLMAPRALSPAASTTFKVDLFRQSDVNDNGAAYTFLLIGLQDLDYKSNSNFDTQGNWGGPITAVGDATLRNWLLASDRCSADGISATTVDAAGFDEWKLIRTNSTVNSAANSFGKAMRVKIKVQREVGTADDSYGHIVIFSGNTTSDSSWTKNVNTFCTSVFMSSVPFQPAA
jgi:hypothetical protein